MEPSDVHGNKEYRAGSLRSKCILRCGPDRIRSTYLRGYPANSDDRYITAAAEYRLPFMHLFGSFATVLLGNPCSAVSNGLKAAYALGLGRRCAATFGGGRTRNGGNWAGVFRVRSG